MKNIAVLLTCFNRKNKTLKCLESLQNAKNRYQGQLNISIYLTDDGSTDGTSDAVAQNFKEVIILKGSGDLYWAEGMRNSWNEALKGNYDAFLLINDDTEFYLNMFQELFLAHEYCTKSHGKSGIYIGATEDKTSGQLTYSGSVITNKFLYTAKRLKPNKTFQQIDLGNANIMLVTKKVVGEIGILAKGYAHGKADYDYTLTAKKAGFPILVSSVYCGHCVNDHIDFYKDFEKKSISERKKLLNKPTGIDFKSQLKFMKKFFPLRAPFVWFFGHLKVYLPSVYFVFLNLRKR